MKKWVVLVLLLALALSLYLKRGAVDQQHEALPKQQTVTKTPLIHKVEAGEGLWQIAQKELGDGMQWGEIAQANGINKPYVIYAGQELKIPGREIEVMSEVGPVYTLTQVAEHTQRDDCWLVIEGKVYDVTPFIKSGFHPGRDAILQGCGRDATIMFNSRPNDGTSHSARARAMLPKYYIGELTP